MPTARVDDSFVASQITETLTRCWLFERGVASMGAAVSITRLDLTAQELRKGGERREGPTTEASHISRSARIARSLGPYNRLLPAPLLPSQRLAACTIATSVAQPELLNCCRRLNLCRRPGAAAPSLSAIASLGVGRPIREARAQRERRSGRAEYRWSRYSLAKANPWLDGLLSRDRYDDSPEHRSIERPDDPCKSQRHRDDQQQELCLQRCAYPLFKSAA